MAVRVRLLIASVLLTALLMALLAATAGGPFASRHWLLFAFYLAAVLLSSGMKVCLLRSDSTMSVNFPFILLAVLQLSPSQAMAVAAISVFAQCRFRVQKFFSLVQIGFNVANAVTATGACWLTYTLLRDLPLAVAPALAAGAVAYFFANTVPVALIVAWTSDRKALDLWRNNFVWFLPFYLVGAALSALAYFLSTHYGMPTALLLVPAAYTIYRSYNAQVARMRDRAQHAADMEALHLRTIESLAMAIEAKDHDTHDHLLRVRVYVTEIGKALNLTEGEMQAVKTAALLHDIGKLAVPERIINKPGKLTPDEFEKMKIHPVVGADILERVRFPYPVVPIVRAHHEWWNGMGYPDGLRGEAIPIGARILTVVDSFDAMASDRPYRRAMSPAEAMATVRKLAGTQFDPRVVEVLEQHCVRLEEQARLEGEKLLGLNTQVVVSRGLAPGAGFEQASGGKTTAAEERDALRFPGPSQSIASLAAQMQMLLVRTESSGYPLVLDETLAMLRTRLAPHIPFDCFTFYLRKGDLLLPQQTGADAARFFSSDAVPVGDGISGWVAKHEQSIVNGNATVEPHYIQQPGREHELRSALSVPLRDLEDSVFGVLTLYAAGENAFSRDHLRAIEAVEATLMLVLRNSMRKWPPEQLEEDESESEHVLIPALHAAISECRAAGQSFALLLCDGAAQADGGRRPTEPMLRWGGLRVVLLPGAGRDQAARHAAALRESLARTRGHSRLAPGIGAACFPGDGETAEALIARAERRMHADKLKQQTLPMPVGAA